MDVGYELAFGCWNIHFGVGPAVIVLSCVYVFVYSMTSVYHAVFLGIGNVFLLHKTGPRSYMIVISFMDTLIP